MKRWGAANRATEQINKECKNNSDGVKVRDREERQEGGVEIIYYLRHLSSAVVQSPPPDINNIP